MPKSAGKFCTLTIAALIALSAHAFAQTKTLTPPSTTRLKAETVTAQHGMVVTDEPLASHIGVEVLRNGGNAVDAAVAVGFALAVTHPTAGNIGGGGFMLVRQAANNQVRAFDYRETAPFAATKDIFLTRGEADPKKSREEGLAVGVPGTVAGLALALQKAGSGKFTLAQLIAPAIELARKGFLVSAALSNSLESSKEKLARWPSTMKIFFRQDGSVLQPGDRLVQRDLANTLETIAREGVSGFYRGMVAKK
ncbi:MAG TPA: gamma-glutamyltransferase, partial [Xanthobacteraceae bacterium]|nr:gamma-glutamyltransferase [Xanthobacteraceae bacterium]